MVTCGCPGFSLFLEVSQVLSLFWNVVYIYKLLCLQLVKLGTISESAARLYLKVSESARNFLATYYNLRRPLYFQFTHLVCRTALQGKSQLPGNIPQCETTPLILFHPQGLMSFIMVTPSSAAISYTLSHCYHIMYNMGEVRDHCRVLFCIYRLQS